VSWRHATLAVWAALAAALVACEVLARVSGGRFSLAAELARRATAPVLGRTVVILAWMWLGWHAFAR
jgi:hypothetical protein